MEFEREEEWLQEFPAAMILTFLLWIVFGVVYAVLLHRKYQKTVDKLATSNSGYVRQADGFEVV